MLSCEQLPDNVAQNGLLRSRQRHEKPDIAIFGGIALTNALLLLPNEIPLFIKLDHSDLKIAHQAVVQPLATVSDARTENHHGIAMRLGQTLGCPGYCNPHTMR